MSNQKSWREKLADDKDLPKVIEIDEKMSKRWGKGTCAIPAPREVDGIMRTVPRGRIITINYIREAVAKKHKATIGCPITTGIFAWIAAYAAEEEADLGKRHITPYWRTLKGKGEINPKYPGGVIRQIRLLEEEGHRVFKKGKRFFIRNYERALLK